MVEETGEGAGKGGYPMTGGNMCWGTPSEGVNSHGSHQEGGGERRGTGGRAIIHKLDEGRGEGVNTGVGNVCIVYPNLGTFCYNLHIVEIYVTKTINRKNTMPGYKRN